MEVLISQKDNFFVKKENILAAPSDLVLTVVSDTAIILDWIDNATVGVVQIEISLMPNSGFTLLDTVPVGDQTYNSKDLNPNTQYFYRLRGFDSFLGYSAYSSTENATTNP